LQRNSLKKLLGEKSRKVKVLKKNQEKTQRMTRRMERIMVRKMILRKKQIETPGKIPRLITVQKHLPPKTPQKS
ncbi:MAG: hypothetical protein J5825_11490, partial [Lachnospiraceae bacterium]|nr:hypothetical protein [Lachnospiraceae bacterium]